MIRSKMMGLPALSLSSLAFLAVDDGTGNGNNSAAGVAGTSPATGGPTAGAGIVQLGGSASGTGDGSGARDAGGTGPASGPVGTTGMVTASRTVKGAPVSFDDMGDRLVSLEGDVARLEEAATKPSSVVDDADLFARMDKCERRLAAVERAVKRLDDVLVNIFGREFAAYDAANPA